MKIPSLRVRLCLPPPRPSPLPVCENVATRRPPCCFIDGTYCAVLHAKFRSKTPRNETQRRGVPCPIFYVPTRVHAASCVRPHAAPLPDELKMPKKGKQSPRVKLVVVSKDKLAKSVETIQGLAPYLGACVRRLHQRHSRRCGRRRRCCTFFWHTSCFCVCLERGVVLHSCMYVVVDVPVFLRR